MNVWVPWRPKPLLGVHFNTCKSNLPLVKRFSMPKKVLVCLHGNAFNATLMVNLSASIHCTNFLPSQFTCMRSIITDILWDCMLCALLDLYSQTFFACGVENRKMAPLPTGLYPLCQLYFWHYTHIPTPHIPNENYTHSFKVVNK